MAARRKAKSSRRAKKAKRRAKHATAAKKLASKVVLRKKVAKKRAKPNRARRSTKQTQRLAKAPVVEKVIVDTIEQPAPGVVVVTETEFAVQSDDSASSPSDQVGA
jgi:hypothetical protein